MHVIDRDKAVVFIDEARLQAVELLRSSRSTIMQIALGMNGA